MTACRRVPDALERHEGLGRQIGFLLRAVGLVCGEAPELEDSGPGDDLRRKELQGPPEGVKSGSEGPGGLWEASGGRKTQQKTLYCRRFSAERSFGAA